MDLEFEMKKALSVKLQTIDVPIASFASASYWSALWNFRCDVEKDVI